MVWVFNNNNNNNTNNNNNNNGIMGISVESMEWLLLHCFKVKLEFGNVDVIVVGKPSAKGTLYVLSFVQRNQQIHM